MLARIHDMDVSNPEAPSVKLMSIVSIGRMRAESAAPALKKVHGLDSPGSSLRHACRWAIEQLTGELLPDDGAIVREFFISGWFLEPIDP